MENIGFYGIEGVSENKNINFKIDREILQNSEAMLTLGRILIDNYNFVKEQIDRSKQLCYVTYEGRIIEKWDSNYNKIISDYKVQLEFLNKILASELKGGNNKLERYVIEMKEIEGEY